MTQNRQRGPRPPVPKAPEPAQETPQAGPESFPAPGPTDAPPDPLAALRDAEEPGLPPILGEPDGPEEGSEDDELDPHAVPLVTQEVQDQARAQVVAAWHADTTSVGFLHKGRGCGCSFIAGLALQTVMPVVLDDVDTANLTDPEE